MLLSRVTEFGNFTVLLLLGALIAIWFLLQAGRRAALAWTVALLACAATLAALKLYFLACPLTPFGLRSPSGHAGFSAMVYGGVTLCVLQDPTPWRRWLLSLLGCLWIGLIAWSRYALRAHTPIEIFFGLAIGGGFLLLFGRCAGPLPHQRFPFVPAALIVVACTATLYFLAWRPSFEQWLYHLGRQLIRQNGLCLAIS